MEIDAAARHCAGRLFISIRHAAGIGRSMPLYDAGAP